MLVLEFDVSGKDLAHKRVLLLFYATLRTTPTTTPSTRAFLT